MESIEKQLITSLITILITSQTTDSTTIYHSLKRLPQFQTAANYMIDLLTKSTDLNVKTRSAKLYFNYIKEKSHQLSTLDHSIIFDHFKTLVCETPPLSSIDDYKLYAEGLILLIKSMTTFSPSSLYSTIISWSNDFTATALYALSTIDESFIGHCLSTIVLNYNEKMSTIAPLSFLFQSFTQETVNATVSEFFVSKNVLKKVQDTIIEFFKTTDDTQELKFTLGFSLLGSILHFLPDADSRSFYLNISHHIFNIVKNCDNKMRITALEALCNLPVTDGDGTFNVAMQISSIVPAFAKSITDFDGDAANRLIDFIDRRSIEKCQFAEIIKQLFDYPDQVNSAALLACRYDLVEKFNSQIFPEICENEIQGLTCCFAIEYLNDHHKLERSASKSIIKTILSATKFQNRILNKELPRSFDQLLSVLKLEDVLIEFYENCHFLLDSITMVDKIISILISFSNQQKEFNGLEKIASDESFSEKVYPFLLKFVVSEKDTKLFLSYLFIIGFLNSAKTGKLVDVGSLSDYPISQIFEILIPESCIDILHEKALQDIDKIEGASIVAISLKNTSKPNPATITQSIMNKNPFNDLLFERFFSSAAYLNSDETIKYLAQITLFEDKKEESTFIKRTMMSFFFQEMPPTPKFNPETLLNILNYVSTLKMKPSSVSLLFRLFNSIYDNDGKSLFIFTKLCKQHQKCNISDQFIQFIITSDFFVETIPDFLYHVEELGSEILCKALNTYFTFSSSQNFRLFCESAFANYQIKNEKDDESTINNSNSENTEQLCFNLLAEQLLKKTDIYKMMSFALQLCQYRIIGCSKETISKLTIQTAMNILSNDDNLKTLCQNVLQEMYLKDKNELPVNQITSVPFNEAVDNICLFFDVIVESEIFQEFSEAIINMICEVTPIELPIAALALSICKKQKFSQKLILYLTKEGYTNHAFIKYLVENAISEAINSHNYQDFIDTLVTNNDLSNKFSRELIVKQFKFNENYHKELINYVFSLFMKDFKTKLNDNDVQTGKVQLYLLICASNTVKEDDYRLIWLSCFVFSNFYRSANHLSIIPKRECRVVLNNSIKSIFSRLRFECPEIEDRDVVLIESFAKRIAQFIFSLTTEDIKAVFKARKEIHFKKIIPSDIIVVSTLVLSYLLKLYSRLKHPNTSSTNLNLLLNENNQNTNQESQESNNNNKQKNNEDEELDYLTTDIAELSIFGKDEACRIISAKFATLFTGSNLKLFSEENRQKLLNCAIRSLITPDKITQNPNVIFLSTLLTVTPKESIFKEKKRLLESITKCFDMKEIVGIEILLDSLQSIVSVDPAIEPFNNMGQISIPRLFILSVNDSEVIRRKSTEILKLLSRNDDFITGFVEILGIDAVTIFGNFFVDWSSKNGLNKYSLELLVKISHALKSKTNKNTIANFLKKVGAILLPIVYDSGSNSSLQALSIEILSVLME
ncbi:hypothetical protein TRFO_14266 [Tritrichomonas foetus]|uniref:Uncharacterized protein n=1 Tax=Tritrichomonas foetus TaxID=1144522 RepID=A0A1J4KVH3_9EUKA|nr:hypothetical protein TRFO_14266 [Tritrichomonas foetus]|eukprot:OHT15239.1 hypothetical protein TRFO_14266 [Tritrichomonas foetus]